MVQEMANGNLASIVRELRENLSERLVIAQFAIVHEQHHRHRRELLANRSQTEVCFRRNGDFRV